MKIRSLDLEGSHETIVEGLKDIEVLVSAIAPFDQLKQIPLATAAKAAGVRRFFVRRPQTRQSSIRSP